MKAVILAGGYGKRLRPLTENLPKPLVEVAGRPIIDWEVGWLKSHGVDSYVMLVGYLKEKIMRHFDSLKDEMGIRVDYSVEESPLGTGGALRNARKFLKNDDQFFMLNGDNITNIDVSRMGLDGAMAAIALVPLRSTYGITHLEGRHIVKFEEKPVMKEYWMNSGVYLMSNRILEHLPESGNLESTTFVELSRSKSLLGVKFPDAYFKGVDSIKDMEEATHDLKSNSIFGDK